MSDHEPILTNHQGHPVRDNQNTITVGPKGPATLENYNMLEKIAHFDRERVPERVVHARGASAHGFFEAYGMIGDEPPANIRARSLLADQGKQTPVFVRFSTVIHSKDSPETLRDPRGFAVKFYTEDGNWDLVGNNLRVFFIRDAIKFPDFIHSFKPDPVNNWQDPNRQFDFISQTPESIHMITLLFSRAASQRIIASKKAPASIPTSWSTPKARPCSSSFTGFPNKGCARSRPPKRGDSERRIQPRDQGPL